MAISLYKKRREIDFDSKTVCHTAFYENSLSFRNIVRDYDTRNTYRLGKMAGNLNKPAMYSHIVQRFLIILSRV